MKSRNEIWHTLPVDAITDEMISARIATHNYFGTCEVQFARLLARSVKLNPIDQRFVMHKILMSIVSEHSEE